MRQRDGSRQRLRGPDLVESEDEILVAYAVETLGAALCPGNPWTEVSIDLAAPLGDRQLFDGLQVPPAPISRP